MSSPPPRFPQPPLWKRAALITGLGATIFAAIAGAAALFSLIAAENARQDAVVWPWPPEASTPLAPPETLFAPLDPAIIPLLEQQPAFAVRPLVVLGGVVPVGAYMPRTSGPALERPDIHPLPTMAPLPTAFVMEQATDAGILPTPTEARSELGGPPLAAYAGDGCAPSGLPTGGLLTQLFHRWHSGVDYGIPVGTPVLATHSGLVTFAGWSTIGYGNLVILQNGAFSTYYAHLSAFNVLEGQRVGAGSVIAWSGNTGNSTGPHIHYEVRINDVPVDPLTFDNRGYPGC